MLLSPRLLGARVRPPSTVWSVGRVGRDVGVRAEVEARVRLSRQGGVGVGGTGGRGGRIGGTGGQRHARHSPEHAHRAHAVPATTNRRKDESVSQLVS
eukprot:344792-Prorocentrum_minimum.AAC.1